MFTPSAPTMVRLLAPARRTIPTPAGLLWTENQKTPPTPPPPRGPVAAPAPDQQAAPGVADEDVEEPRHRDPPRDDGQAVGRVAHAPQELHLSLQGGRQGHVPAGLPPHDADDLVEEQDHAES